MTASLTHEALSKSIGTNFEAEAEPDKFVKLQLAEVSDLKRSERQEDFAIVLSGPADAFLGQGIRRMRHEEFGQFELFIVPISQDEHGYRYEAVFNRFREETAPSNELQF